MTKTEAIIELMRDARAERHSTASAKRITRACKVLGLNMVDTREILAWLDYCDQGTGEPHKPAHIQRVWA